MPKNNTLSTKNRHFCLKVIGFSLRPPPSRPQHQKQTSPHAYKVYIIMFNCPFPRNANANTTLVNLTPFHTKIGTHHIVFGLSNRARIDNRGFHTVNLIATNRELCATAIHNQTSSINTSRIEPNLLPAFLSLTFSRQIIRETTPMPFLILFPAGGTHSLWAALHQAIEKISSKHPAPARPFIFLLGPNRKNGVTERVVLKEIASMTERVNRQQHCQPKPFCKRDMNAHIYRISNMLEQK